MATFFDLVIVFSNSQNDHWKKTTRAFALNVGVWIFLLTGILILNLLSNSASIFVWIFGNPYIIIFLAGLERIIIAIDNQQLSVSSGGKLNQTWSVHIGKMAIVFTQTVRQTGVLISYCIVQWQSWSRKLIRYSFRDKVHNAMIRHSEFQPIALTHHTACKQNRTQDVVFQKP